LQSARLLQQIPVVAEKLESGSLNLSQTTKLQKCLRDQKQKSEVMTEDKAQELIAKLENKNTFETEKVLALEFNLPIQTHELLKPQKDDSVRLETVFSWEQYQELIKSKELLSHICPDGTWTEVIATLAKKFNQSKTPKESKQPLQNKQKQSSTLASKPTTQSLVAKQDNGIPNSSSAYRPSISTKIKAELMHKADYCCEYQDVKTKNRCHSTYKLEIDHIQPLAMGGSNYTDNLRVLCRTHNVLMAKRSGLNYFDN
jgi:hypothetical protein